MSRARRIERLQGTLMKLIGQMEVCKSMMREFEEQQESEARGEHE